MGIVDLHIEGERRLKTRCEDLDALDFGERAHVWQQGLETVLVVDDGAGPLARHELAQWVGACRGTEPQVEELGEAAPWRSALILLHLDIP